MKIGDKIAVLDEDISGHIVAFTGSDVTIMTQDGFEMQYAKNEIVVESNSLTKKQMLPQNISEIISEKEVKKHKNTTRIRPKERSMPPMEVDLHIHQLTNNQKGLSNYDMLTLQMDTAKRQLEFAISKRLQRVVFIHGIGDGVLRAELDFLFKRYDNLEYYDADYQKYGRGATEVYIFQSKNP
ncbi:hypothetical protein ATE92_2497 [Ulvibacter sp. MAR_2010_11]|uniref:Smr/MutS family protein n=1 Tax=Ulvibacter sp. MAR_2010_11 TaxID=1250229 RepID=UPI000C2CD8BE|nr:Smr/MutS family protein [Ulvibacter sp. MAR_2010_11]PKA84315.1 hypothetical protein ATE92_2497 [Ulvibacter sp. MAR_2010_11]